MNPVKKSFKELCESIEEISYRFFVAKKMSVLIEKGEVLAENNIACETYLNKVEKAYSSLEPIEQNLINNEFFFQSYHDWWIGLYSKANYYRVKKKAMISFLEAFYHA